MYNIKHYKCKKCHSVYLATSKTKCLECQMELDEHRDHEKDTFIISDKTKKGNNNEK